MTAKLLRVLAGLFLAVLFTSSCSPNSGGAGNDPELLNAVATTSIVGDLVREVGGDRVAVISLMGPGVDPHLYKATASDVTALRRAEIVERIVKPKRTTIMVCDCNSDPLDDRVKPTDTARASLNLSESTNSSNLTRTTMPCTSWSDNLSTFSSSRAIFPR